VANPSPPFNLIHPVPSSSLSSFTWNSTGGTGRRPERPRRGAGRRRAAQDAARAARALGRGGEPLAVARGLTNGMEARGAGPTRAASGPRGWSARTRGPGAGRWSDGSSARVRVSEDA
jgi:hypothetical protein